MELENLIDIVNQHMRDEGQIGFPSVVDSLPEKMKAQSSDIDGIDTEWVWQVVDQFDCYHGEIAFQLDDGRYLKFGFCG